MARKNWLVGFGAGLLAGIVATFALSGGLALPRAAAQVPGAELTPFPVGAVATPRYQVSSWAYTGFHGAYVIDTQTGQVWEFIMGQKLRKVGTVGKE